jgi:oxygen-independent coproporphyrinogen III oxidase
VADPSVTQITLSRSGLEGQSSPITANDLFPVGFPIRAGAGGQAAGVGASVAGVTAGGAATGRRLGLYIHVPFCFHKCHYCDFYSIVDSRDRQGQFVARLIEEIEAAAELLPSPLETIFVGGGTPTLLAAPLWADLLAALSGAVLRLPGAEFTVEANPETVTPELADVLVAGGVNRVSIGAQSFNPVHLKTLERWHDPRNVGRAVEIFRAAGVGSINLDLIFAIPGQSVTDWVADLDAAIALECDHLSCYGLMYEPNTPLTQKLRQGKIAPVDDESAAAMYESSMERLADAGFEHYEISAWAKPGKRCRHNVLYWTNQDWWPLGPSASGHVGGTRWKNVSRLAEYLDERPGRGGLPPITDVERLDADGRVGEELMLRLRLVDGIERSWLEGLLREGARGGERAAAIEKAIAENLLEEREGWVRLTRRGLLLADVVLAELV